MEGYRQCSGKILSGFFTFRAETGHFCPFLAQNWPTQGPLYMPKMKKPHQAVVFRCQYKLIQPAKVIWEGIDNVLQRYLVDFSASEPKLAILSLKIGIFHPLYMPKMKKPHQAVVFRCQYKLIQPVKVIWEGTYRQCSTKIFQSIFQLQSQNWPF